MSNNESDLEDAQGHTFRNVQKTITWRQTSSFISPQFQLLDPPPLSSSPMFDKSKNVVATNCTFTEIQAKDTAFEQLQKETVPAALHDYGKRFSPPRCHKDTRRRMLNVISDWIDLGGNGDGKNPTAMWLRGLAGLGKSAIAQTIAEQCARDKTLLATFFFSRFDPSRNNIKSLAATIAYQVALNIPGVLNDITEEIKLDPLIFERSLETQFLSLLIRPLQRLFVTGNYPSKPRLIILDGLDECEEQDAQVYLVQIIREILMQSRLPIRILILSRPEQHLTITFDCEAFNYKLQSLDLDGFFEEDDIRIFLQDKLEEIKKTHPLRRHIPSNWPSSDTLSTLIDKASGQFIYAATVVRYVASIRHSPMTRLETILGTRAPKDAVSPFSALDEIYTTILSSVEDIDRLLDVLSLIFGVSSLRPWMVDQMLAFDEGESELLLGPLSSILSTYESLQDLQEHWSAHASFYDFLHDASRSKALYLDTPQRHTRLAIRCIELIGEPETDGLGYVRRCLPKHILHSEFTPDVREGILNFPFATLYNDPRTYHPVYITFIIEYLNSTKDLDFDFHHLHVQTFREYVLSQVDKYYSEPRLTLAIAVVYMICEGVAFLDRSAVYNNRYPHHPSETVDYASLKLIDAVNHDEYEGVAEYMQLVYGTLEDPKYHSEFSMNGERYATAALVYLEHVCPAKKANKILEISEKQSKTLSHLLEKSQWSEEIASFIDSNAAAKGFVKEIVSSGNVQNGVISRYL